MAVDKIYGTQYGTQGALDRQGDDSREREALLSHPLGVFTTILTRASSDVPTRSIRLLM
jgi:hypothetical protein